MTRRVPRVLLGVPTHQEAKTVAAVAESLDKAALSCRRRAEFILVNMDNRSPDGTRARFLAASTRLPKVGLQTAPGILGKGANLRLLFEYAVAQRADAAITIDADLEIVPPEWIDTFLTAVMDNGAGIAVPLYGRTWYDANQTNQLVAPLVLAITGQPVRQPIGGDYAFSPAFMRRILEKQWLPGAQGFGIDPFLVLTGLEGSDLVQVLLTGGKFHSWRSDTPEQIEDEFPIKFHTSNSTLFTLLAAWPQACGELPSFPATPEIDRSFEKPYDLKLMRAAGELGFEREAGNPEYAALLGGAAAGPPDVDDDIWARVLVTVLERARSGRLSYELLEAFRALFFSRVATVQPGLHGLSQAEIDQHVYAVAQAIRKRVPSDV
ncbi:glycosyltransferase [Micromonospora sp. KC207]|uniref:glycosyltransferase n=1 Tax=Micromonospora sp. KC207 TaxID=2530377 RepID=UPI00104F219B|nr:glycosyltransferase [Micromonospora sp. KC207]TDC65128.1 glycosyltransferase [Micromonospora sp. KC207]